MKKLWAKQNGAAVYCENSHSAKIRTVRKFLIFDFFLNQINYLINKNKNKNNKIIKIKIKTFFKIYKKTIFF